MNKIKEYYFEVESNKIENKRIILLSDIHYYNKKEYLRLDTVYKHMLKLRPDYILIAGDLLDEAFVYDLDKLHFWFQQISELSPVYISIGNHDLLVKEDFETDFNKEFFLRLENIPDVHILNDIVHNDGEICFYGLTMPAEYFYVKKEPKTELIDHMNNIFFEADSSQLNILLCHTPLAISKEEVLQKIKIKDYLDLIVCGHTHGGITPGFLRPLLRGVGIISPLRKLFFKNAYGQKKIDNTNLIISSGITKAGHRNRFHKLNFLFNSEITIIDIKKRNRS